MISFQKTPEVATQFAALINGLDSYEALREDTKRAVEALLLEEQKGLCPFCERGRKKIGTTIEHFLPKSHFPSLQLNYYNLYVACLSCNNLKGDFLIPPYIFDIRFDVTKTFDDLRGCKPKYEPSDAHVRTVIPAANIAGKGKELTQEHHNAFILYQTLELLQNNRKELTIARREVYDTVTDRIGRMSNERLLQKYNDYVQPVGDYAEYVSLKAQLLWREIYKRNLPHLGTHNTPQ